MSCAELEEALARWLAGEEEPDSRAPALAALRAHAAACADCRGLSDLLELLSLPRAERDFAEGPPERYWDEFETALRRRLRGGASRAAQGWTPWAGVAAALVLAAIGSWLVLSAGGGGVPQRAAAPRAGSGAEIPFALDVLLRRAGPEEALAGLEFLAGLGGVPESVSAAADGPREELGGPERDGLYSIDPQELDAEIRSALLEWLRERTPRGRGVES